MSAEQLLQVLSIALVLIMAIVAGLKVSAAEIVGAVRRVRLMLLGLLASFVLVPLATVAILHLFHPPPMASVGFLVVAVCAGAPFSVPGTTVAKGDVPVAIGLMTISAALSVVLAPLLLKLLLSRLPGAGELHIDYLGILIVLLFSQIVPLGLALAFHHWKPEVAMQFVGPATLLQNVLMVAVVVTGLYAQRAEVAKFSLWAFGGMLVLVLFGTVVGWLLGGPDTAARKALAFCTLQRNTGIAVVIASANFAGTPAVTVTVVMAIFLALSGLVLQFVLRRL